MSRITGFPVQPNKAIVGANAFAHESGIHQDGVLKQRDTYEIMRAEDVGWSANKIVLGKLSGPQRVQAAPAGARHRARRPRRRCNAAFERFKELADKKREIFDEDMQALVSEEAGHVRRTSTTAGRADRALGDRRAAARAASCSRTAAAEARAEAQGNGPVDAVVQGDREHRRERRARCCSIRSTRSPPAPKRRARSRCGCRRAGASSTASGADTDIVVASAKAYINALNKLHSKLERMNPQV